MLMFTLFILVKEPIHTKDTELEKLQCDLVFWV